MSAGRKCSCCQLATDTLITASLEAVREPDEASENRTELAIGWLCVRCRHGHWTRDIAASRRYQVIVYKRTAPCDVSTSTLAAE